MSEKRNLPPLTSLELLQVLHSILERVVLLVLFFIPSRLR